MKLFPVVMVTVTVFGLFVVLSCNQPWAEMDFSRRVLVLIAFVLEIALGVALVVRHINQRRRDGTL